MDRLALSIWPFILVAPGELLGAFLIRRTNPTERMGLLGLMEVSLVLLIGLAFAFICLVIARRLVERSRSAWWRGVPCAIAIYVFIAVLSGVLMVVLLIDRGPTGQPAFLTVLYIVTRPVYVLIIAIVVQQVRDGVATTRAVDAITQDQLLLVRQANEMIEAAEQDLRADSLRMFAAQVARPLRQIVRDGPGLDDTELADRLDDFIETRLRPMAHVLHPVSVRLGLISAMRSLNPDVTVDATPTVQRMDSDGVLLDDEVRLQLYRWIRAGLPSQGASRAALVIRGRELQVSLHPATPAPVDAVQSAAGLRLLAPALVSAPLLGQAAEVSVLDDALATPSARPARYRLRDLLTVPLPIRLVLVAALSIASAPLQFIVYRWSSSPVTILTALSGALAPIAVAWLLGRLPPPSRSIAGAWRVVTEWLVIAAASAVALAALGTAFALLPPGLSEWGLIFSRVAYRYAIPGLMVTLSYGLVVESQRRLERARQALAVEERRRVEILGKARQLDRDVAEALHRNVQARLAAAVVLLRLDQRQEAWSLVIEMSSEEIPWLLDRMGEEPSGRGLVPDPPMGLTVIQVDELPVDDGTFDLLARAVGEVAVNARRHGRASTLVISVHADHGRCRVVCEDDGVGMPADVVPGLGLRLLDDTMSVLGGTWCMDSSHPGCRVTLDIPVRNSPPLHATASGLASSDV
jgi:hypothetical protein